MSIYPANAWITNMTVSGSTNTYAYWPVQISNPLSTFEDEIGWLRRRVSEITNLVSVN